MRHHLTTRIRQLLAAMRQHRDERATRQALASLDGRTLRDIGLDRSEILSLARELSDTQPGTRTHALAARNRF